MNCLREDRRVAKKESFCPSSLERSTGNGRKSRHPREASRSLPRPRDGEPAMVTRPNPPEDAARCPLEPQRADALLRDRPFAKIYMLVLKQ